MRPNWWSKYDEPILAILAESGKALPPRVILFNLEYEDRASPHRSTVKRRLAKLEEHGLVERVDEAGYYVITEDGERYLAGEMDGSELESESED